MEQYKGILSFSGYTELSTIVCDLLSELNKINNTHFDFIINKIKLQLIELLENLSKGYSRFYKKDKMQSYLYAKDTLCSIISNLYILYKLSVFPKDLYNKYCDLLNKKYSLFNGLLKKIGNRKEDKIWFMT